MTDGNSGFSLIAIATVVAGLGALFVIGQSLLVLYRRTIGRSRDRRTRLARLGAGAHISFFEAVLGEPPAMSRSIRKDDSKRLVTQDDPDFNPSLAELGEFFYTVAEPRIYTECTFVDRAYYVQAICSDDDGTVLAFSVTTRSGRFHPTYELPFRPGYFERLRLRRKFGFTYTPLLRVKLGESTFASLDPAHLEEFAPPNFRVSVGARNWTYSELRYLGNPGYYQWIVLTASDVAGYAAHGDLFKVQQEIDNRSEWPYPDENDGGTDSPSWDSLRVTQQFRGETVVTTYTVVGVQLDPDNYPSTFGPHIDVVRTLP
ncbi:MAG: ETEC_3214 domain-containing protein [Solirubrobacteraceae bacterium]